MTDWCSWWLEWSWSYCCYEHDYKKLTDWGLKECIMYSPVGLVIGTVFGYLTYVGLKVGGPFYRFYKHLTRKK